MGAVSYDVAPIFRCSATFYRQQPVLILAASHALTRLGGRVKLEKTTLRNLTAAMGFRELDRALLPITEVTNVFIACGSNGVTFETEDTDRGRHPSLAVDEVAVPSAEWLAATQQQALVQVLFVVPPAAANGAVDLRRLLGSGRAFGGLAQAVAIDTGCWHERYFFVSGRGTEPPLPQAHSVILDSSVLVDLERVASGETSEEVSARAQNLVLQLAHMDSIPGSAIAELTVDRENDCINLQRARSLAAATSAWFDGGVGRARDIGAVRRAYVEQLDSLDQDELPGLGAPFIVSAYYASLLKLACIWNEAATGTFEARRRVVLYEGYVEWMLHTLGIVCVYPLQVARDRLVGPQNQAVRYTDKLLKLGTPSLRKLWGAAWDLMHLASIDMIQAGDLLEVDGRAAMLVTADKALVSLRERIVDPRVGMECEYGHLPAKFGRNDVDLRLRDHESRIAAIGERMNDVVVARAGRHAGQAMIDNVTEEVLRLERALTRHALTRPSNS
jgi:hypothetical protein